MDLKEAKNRIRRVGETNVRVVPMPGQVFDGDHRIEICEGGIWISIISGLRKSMAESIVREAINRVILG